MRQWKTIEYIGTRAKPRRIPSSTAITRSRWRKRRLRHRGHRMAPIGSTGSALFGRPAAETISRAHHAGSRRPPRARSRDQAAQIRSRLRWREEVSLRLVAVECNERGELILRLDAFGSH